MLDRETRWKNATAPAMPRTPASEPVQACRNISSGIRVVLSLSSDNICALWRPNTMSEPVFLTALVIAGTTIVLVAGAIAGALRGRGSSRSEVAQLSEQLKDHAAALDDVQNTLATQSSQMAELHERLDFAERLLAQGRDRTALKPES